VENPGEVASNLVPLRRHRRAIAYERQVTGGWLEPVVAQHRGHPRQKIKAPDPLVRGVGVGEVLPEVAQAGRSEQSIGQGVTDDVTIGVAKEAAFTLEVDAAQVERTPLAGRVRVQAYPNSDIAHGEGPTVRGGSSFRRNQ
jgi:hypothetical protein